MNSDWVTSVDMLADAGIVNFDAAAYITGAPARFIGSPQYPIYNIPPLAPPIQKDSYQASDTSIVKTPVWKKVLFGALAIGGALWGISKIKKAPQMFKNAFEKFAGLLKRK